MDYPSTPDTQIDLVDLSTAQPYVTINEAIDALSPALYWGRRASTCAGLTWGYYGGVVPDVAASPVGPTRVDHGTLALDPSATCYVEHDTDTGDVTFNTSGATGGGLALDYIVTTSASGITDWLDVRMSGGVGTAGTVPTGTGIPHIVSGVQNGAASLIVAADITDDVVTNAKLAEVATATIKGRTTAGTGNPEDMTATQATAILNAMVGDSGSGGTKGLVPAPGAGDAAALKFLKADGTYAVPAGSSAAIDLHTRHRQSWHTDGGATSAMYTFGTQIAEAGTGTSVAQTNTNLFTSIPMRKWASSAVAGNSCGIRSTILNFWRGDAAGLGGFKASLVFGVFTPQADMRVFCGIRNAATLISNVEPSSLTNVFAMAVDSGDANYSLLHNDSGTAVMDAMGANFPVQTTQTDLFRVTIECTANGAGFTVLVERLNTGHTFSQTYTTDIPLADQFFQWQIWANNGVTAAAVVVAASRVDVTQAP